jgi:hypothetical protein
LQGRAREAVWEKKMSFKEAGEELSGDKTGDWRGVKK